MAESSQDSGVINIEAPPNAPRPAVNPLMELLANKRVKDLVFDIAEKQIKDAAGIDTARKVNNKTPFGRTVATMKDFIQGVWWVAVLGTFFMGLVIIALMWLRKLAGV